MLDLGGLELRDPLFLLIGLLALPVYWLASRLPASVTYSSLSLVNEAPRSLRTRLSSLPAGLLAHSVLQTPPGHARLAATLHSRGLRPRHECLSDREEPAPLDPS